MAKLVYILGDEGAASSFKSLRREDKVSALSQSHTTNVGGLPFMEYYLEDLETEVRITVIEDDSFTEEQFRTIKNHFNRLDVLSDYDMQDSDLVLLDDLLNGEVH